MPLWWCYWFITIDRSQITPWAFILNVHFAFKSVILNLKEYLLCRSVLLLTPIAAMRFSCVFRNAVLFCLIKTHWTNATENASCEMRLLHALNTQTSPSQIGTYLGDLKQLQAFIKKFLRTYFSHVWPIFLKYVPVLIPSFCHNRWYCIQILGQGLRR